MSYAEDLRQSIEIKEDQITSIEMEIDDLKLDLEAELELEEGEK